MLNTKSGSILYVNEQTRCSSKQRSRASERFCPEQHNGSRFQMPAVKSCLGEIYAAEDVKKGLGFLATSAAAAFCALTPASNADIRTIAAPTFQSLEMNAKSSVQLIPPIPTSFAPLPEIRTPAFIEETLPNGLHVYLLEDHEVPLVQGSLLTRGGRYTSPRDKVGLVTIAAAVQRAGGSTEHPADELNARLEDLAASIETSSGNETLSAGFYCSKEDMKEVLGLMSEILKSPVLPESKIQQVKNQIYSQLEHQYDNPSSVAALVTLQQMYGQDSLYARQATRTSVESITREDIQRHLQQWQRPDGAVLGVVGDFKAQEMMTWIRDSFGSWGETSSTTTGQVLLQPMDMVSNSEPAWWSPVPAGAELEKEAASQSSRILSTAAGGDDKMDEVSVSSSSSSSILSSSGSAGLITSSASPLGRIFFVDKPGVLQASVEVAEPGLELTHPDVPALEVLTGMYNGFGGTLFNQDPVSLYGSRICRVEAQAATVVTHHNVFSAIPQSKLHLPFSCPAIQLCLQLCSKIENMACPEQQVRSRDGLAYSVSASWDFPFTHRGIFSASAQTSDPGPLLLALETALKPYSPESAPPVTSSTPSPVAHGTMSEEDSQQGTSLQTSYHSQDDWPNEMAVQASKEQFLNSFVFNYSSQAQQLRRIMAGRLLGLPEDLLLQLQRGVTSVTPQQVHLAADRYLHTTCNSSNAGVAGNNSKSTTTAASINDGGTASLPQPAVGCGQVIVVIGDEGVMKSNLEKAGFEPERFVSLKLPAVM
ncbi:hypothetical protein CEUSTIGMA_g53.t1 [Chlamydomonas eustigma]|uniref:Peptidase M16 C-terminal domain-containing protein n=1 Tax=Chlamydomonas eustigma TaxID=1157962 RepID=A0A250WP40_9CHLO|nr:hypothetical protein CEUSTIGMA_g53.t1 [Chlamydomonas eustigma]|eukprot:GAX72597.1 hypothetical protein CEUSTIGMA_g53.t1 [Chlamydomonas eustigma]